MRRRHTRRPGKVSRARKNMFARKLNRASKELHRLAQHIKHL